MSAVNKAKSSNIFEILDGNSNNSTDSLYSEVSTCKDI